MKRSLVALFTMIAGCRTTFCLAPMPVNCAPTAEAAIARLLEANAGSVFASPGSGYRVVSLRTDVLHAKRYALIASCSDSARPLQSFEVLGGAAPAQLPSVHLGDRVTVLASHADSQMRLTGRAEEGGGRDDMVRVEMPRISEDAAARVIRCRVVGNDVVEVIP